MIRKIVKLAFAGFVLLAFSQRGIAQDLASLAEMMHGPSYDKKREMRLAMRLQANDAKDDSVSGVNQAIIQPASLEGFYQDESPSDRAPGASNENRADEASGDAILIHEDPTKRDLQCWSLPGGFAATPYGEIRGEMIYAQNSTAADAALFFFDPNSPGVGDDSFTIHARTTSLNFAICGPDICGWRSSGLIELNLLGQQPLRNETGIHVVSAFGALENNCSRITFGRMSDLFSPINPGTLNWGVQRGAGNVGVYRAGFGIDRWFCGDNSKWTVSARLSESTPDDYMLIPTTRGTDNGFPNLEGRIGVELGPSCNGIRPIEIGISGLWGETRAFDPNAVNQLFGNVFFLGVQQEVSTTAGMNIDFQLRYARAGLRGEFWMAQSAGTYFAGALQSLNAQTGRGIRSIGAWAEIYFQYNPCATISLGGGLDDPRNQDVGFITVAANDPGQRTFNSVVWTTLNRKFTDRFEAGIEFSYRKSHYLNPDASSSGLITHFVTTLRY